MGTGMMLARGALPFYFDISPAMIYPATTLIYKVYANDQKVFPRGNEQNLV